MTQSADTTAELMSYVRHQAAKGLESLAALMERTEAECARCLQDVNEERASFKPNTEWSIKEVLGHMLSSGAGVNREIANLVKGDTSPSPVGMGIVAGADRPIGELRKRVAELWQETRRLVSSLPEDGDLERRWEHPVFGPLNFKEWIVFQRLHTLDHLQQIEKVKAQPDYPAG